METDLCALAPANWQIRSVEDVCVRVTSGGTPSRREPSYYAGGSWPWVKTQELQDKWLDDTEEHITDEAVASSSAKVLPENTVLVAMYGATVGQLGILRRPMTCNQACSALIVDPAKADYRYLFFQLLHARSLLKGLATGAAQQNLSGVLVKSLRFPFPPLPEQRAIAHILGTLDDKIELNRRMNETLETMARAIFKSWFVDFNPVRAKAEGRLPAGRQATPPPPKPGAWFVYALECENGSVYVGHAEDVQRRFDEHARGKGAEWTKRHPPRRIAYWEDLSTRAAAAARERKLKTGSGRKWLKQEIARRDLSNGGLPQPLADLFPARFVDSELGEIPEGWKVRSLDEIARFLNGLALQKYPPKDGRSLPVIKIAQLRAGNTTGADRASAELEPEYIVQDGDTLFSWSGSLECMLWAGGPGALNQHLFKVASADYPMWLCYLGIHLHLDDFRHIAAGKATTMGHIQRHHLSDAKLAVPPQELLQAMDKVIHPIVESTWRRAVQSRTLAALRDTLLPKLISGELRIGYAGGIEETAR